MKPVILLHSLCSECGRVCLMLQFLRPKEPQEIIPHLSVHWWYPFLGATPEQINALPSDLSLFVSWFQGEMWSGGSTAVQLCHEIGFPLYHTVLQESGYGGTTGTRSQMPSETPILQKPKTKTALGNTDAVFSMVVEKIVSLLKATSVMHCLATQEQGINKPS